MKTTKERADSGNRRKAVLALVLATAFAVQSTSANIGVAVADRGPDQHHRTADVTFTKWIVRLGPDPSTSAGSLMAGVVGGDVGRGAYSGEILSDDTVSRPNFWLGHARYEFHGSKHSFIADVHITEDDRTQPVTATIRGVVTEGWMKGARVTGEYTVVDVCPIPTKDNVFAPSCIPGRLHLRLGRNLD